jgi:hypothetical protein
MSILNAFTDQGEIVLAALGLDQVVDAIRRHGDKVRLLVLQPYFLMTRALSLSKRLPCPADARLSTGSRLVGYQVRL